MSSPVTLNFLHLPNEIIQQILRYLGPLTLVKLCRTCQTLQVHAEDDVLWAGLVNENLPHALTSPSPRASWKELYSAHYPYWFLPRHRLWFADKATVGSGLAGQLVIARYDPRVGYIEAYRLVAEFAHGQHTTENWDWRPDVLIHRFTPKVRLFLDDPVLRLEPGDPFLGGRLQQELLMQSEADKRYGIRSLLFPTIPIPPDLQDPTMSLWPPKIIPAVNRVRNDSPSMFRGDGHKPQTFGQLCDTAFRLRKWTQFRGLIGRPSVRMGEDVLTFSSLPPACYTPTRERPYQGIWVGDYAGHGCEFLVIIQTPKEGGHYIASDVGQSIQRHLLPDSIPGFAVGIGAEHTHEQHATTDDADLPGCSGRLEAIKLTGDPNVPRGEYTWISEDIGRRGLIRIADENVFRGSRVVKSWGHIAANGFREDRYMESQLILVSHDCLAQYWESFGHISFYLRVNIDDFLRIEDPSTK